MPPLVLFRCIHFSEVGTSLSNLSRFLSFDNWVNFRNIKRNSWVSKNDVGINPKVKIQLLMSSQRGNVIIFFCDHFLAWDLIWAVLVLLFQVVHGIFRVLGLWFDNQKISFCTGLHMIPTEKMIITSNYIKKKTIIVLTTVS